MTDKEWINAKDERTTMNEWMTYPSSTNWPTLRFAANHNPDEIRDYALDRNHAVELGTRAARRNPRHRRRRCHQRDVDNDDHSHVGGSYHPRRPYQRRRRR